jgi:hypothetical protein
VAAGAKEADRHGVAVLENEDQQEQQDDGEYRGTYPGGAGSGSADPMVLDLWHFG